MDERELWAEAMTAATGHLRVQARQHWLAGPDGDPIDASVSGRRRWCDMATCGNRMPKPDPE
jgi:hypothetical protein